MNTQMVIKRALDLLVAGTALLVLSPVLAVVALLVRFRMGSPILYRQVRPGLHAQPFTLFKFRTMLEAFDAEGRPLSDAERLTPFGRLLRRTSLDELPQLWNVVRGEMSLVGPRPLLMEYLDHYSPEQMRRHEVKPGITGLAQVSGRNLLEWEEKFALDIRYAECWSLGLDVRILARTVWLVLHGAGAWAPSGETMPSFSSRARSHRTSDARHPS